MATASLAPGPPHVPADRIIDFDVYNPVGIEHGFHQAWMQLQVDGVPDLAWTPRNGGHWLATRGHLIAIQEIIITLQEWLKRIPEFRFAKGFALVAHPGVVAQVERLDLEWNPA